MNKSDRLFDPRIRKIGEKVQDAEDRLCSALESLEDLPEKERAKAIAALKNVFDVGVVLGEHKHAPVMSNPDQPLIGPDLRAHLKEAQAVRERIDQLLRIADQTLDERNKRNIRSEHCQDIAA